MPIYLGFKVSGSMYPSGIYFGLLGPPAEIRPRLHWSFGFGVLESWLRSFVASISGFRAMYIQCCCWLVGGFFLLLVVFILAVPLHRPLHGPMYAHLASLRYEFESFADFMDLQTLSL